jgi:hypothetical protein
MVATQSSITVNGRPAVFTQNDQFINQSKITFNNINNLKFPPIALDDPDIEFMKYLLKLVGMPWACMLINGKNYLIPEAEVFGNKSDSVATTLTVPYYQPITTNRKMFLDLFDIPYKTLTHERTKKLYMVTQAGCQWTLNNWRLPVESQAKIENIPFVIATNYSITLKTYYCGDLPLAVRCIGRLLDIEWVLVNGYNIMSHPIILMTSLQELGFVKS